MPRKGKRSEAMKRRYLQRVGPHRPTPESVEGSGNHHENVADVLVPPREIKDEIGDVAVIENVADVLVPPGEGEVIDEIGDVTVTGCYKDNVTSADQRPETRVCASRSQDFERIGRNGKKRCACNSLIFLAFLHENENLTKADLDLVLDKGHVLYQRAPERRVADGVRPLATGDLSDLVPSRSSTLNADFTQHSLYGSFANPAPEAVETFLPLANRLDCLVTDVQYALLFMASLCIAVFRTGSGRFGFFDPHARREDGSLTESGGTGTAVMVTFPHLCDLVERLLCCYELLGVSSAEVYELKPVTFHSTSSQRLLTANTQSVVTPCFNDSPSLTRATKVCLPKEFAAKLSKYGTNRRRKLIRRFLAPEKRFVGAENRKRKERERYASDQTYREHKKSYSRRTYANKILKQRNNVEMSWWNKGGQEINPVYAPGALGFPAGEGEGGQSPVYAMLSPDLPAGNPLWQLACGSAGVDTEVGGVGSGFELTLLPGSLSGPSTPCAPVSLLAGELPASSSHPVALWPGELDPNYIASSNVSPTPQAHFIHIQPSAGTPSCPSTMFMDHAAPEVTLQVWD